jgi:D-alanine-D-alanine ligase
MVSNAINSDNPDRFGKVAVLMGGQTAEREISLQSGRAVLAALQASHIDVEAVDPSSQAGLQKLTEKQYDRVFNALHGRGGEDGVVQGYLEMLRVPYTGSGVLGSALCMDKLRAKQLWQGAGLPTPEWVLLQEETSLPSVGEQLGFPMIIKPVREGSSIGISKVNDQTGLEQAWQAADQYDHQVIAERWISGPEFTAGIIGRQVLPLIRLETPREFYDYEAKYESDTTQYHCPCGLAGDHENALQTLALQSFDVLGASGWGRVDFMLDSDDQPWLIEVNTVPGMTSHSLVPMAAQVAGMEMPELVWRILETSERTESC